MKFKNTLSESQYHNIPIQFKNRYVSEWQVSINGKWHETASPMIHTAKGYSVRNGYRLIK